TILVLGVPFSRAIVQLKFNFDDGMLAGGVTQAIADHSLLPVFGKIDKVAAMAIFWQIVEERNPLVVVSTQNTACHYQDGALLDQWLHRIIEFFLEGDMLRLIKKPDNPLLTKQLHMVIDPIIPCCDQCLIGGRIADLAEQ